MDMAPIGFFHPLPQSSLIRESWRAHSKNLGESWQESWASQSAGQDLDPDWDWDEKHESTKQSKEIDFNLIETIE